MIGVISPFSVATATEMSAWLYTRTKSSIHAELAMGTSTHAFAAALMMKSFTEIFASFSTPSFTVARSLTSSSSPQSIVR